MNYLSHKKAGSRRNAGSSCAAKSGVQRAFTRLDLVVLIGLVVLLVSWIGLGRVGERGRMIRCAGNLAALGKAMHGYAKEHNGTLPAAGISLGQTQSSWDMQVYPYLNPGVDKSDNDRLAKTIPQFFVCPSDKAPHQGKPRSYAMGGNDMTPEHWPPGRDSATGVGLWWDRRTVLSLLDEDALKTPETLPAVRLSDVPFPADTVLLAEFIDPNNTMAGTRQASVLGTSQQRQFFKDGGAKFHRGQFNYLMVDGHVETLSPLQTGAFDGSAGIWSLKKEN